MNSRSRRTDKNHPALLFGIFELQSAKFPVLQSGIISLFLQYVWSHDYCVFFELEGTDSEPKVDFRMDESSDVPILEERSISPIDFLQEQWLVGTDIENIERYLTAPAREKIILTIFFLNFYFCYYLNWMFLSL